ISAAPHLADQMVGQVVEIFLAAARDDLDQPAMHPSFLAEFTDRRRLGVLAVIDAPLWHLPRLGRRIESLADEDAASAIGEHHARAGAIREFAVVDHRAPVASATIAFNTVNAPRISSRALGMPCDRLI